MNWQRIAPDRLIRFATGIGLASVVLALFPYSYDSAFDIKYLIAAGLSLVVAFLVAACAVSSRNIDVRISAPACLLVLLSCVNALTVMRSPNPGHALHWLICMYSPIILAFGIAIAYREVSQVERLFGILCCAVALSSVYGLFQKFGLDPFPWETRNVEEYWGAPSTYGNPNYASHALVLAIVVAVGLSFKRVWRWPMLFLALLMSLHLAVTGSRAGLLSLLAALLWGALSLVLRRRATNPIRFVLSVLAGFTAISLSIAMTALLVHRVVAGTWIPIDTSLLLRYNSFLTASRILWDGSLFGHGPGSYVLVSAPYWTGYEQYCLAVKKIINAHVHNEYLEMGIEGGFLGLFLYVALLSFSLLHSLIYFYREQDQERRFIGVTLSSCFLAFAVDSFFGFNFHVPVSGLILFVLLGILAARIWSDKGATTPTTNRFSATILMASCVCLALIACVQQTKYFISQVQFQRAGGAKEWGANDTALELLDSSVRLAPWNWLSLTEAGRVACLVGRSDLALDLLKRAEALNPNSIPIYVEMGSAYTYGAQIAAGRQAEPLTVRHRAALEELLKAEDALNTGLKLCPVDPRLHELLGGVWSLRASIHEENQSESEVNTAFELAVEHYEHALRFSEERKERARIYTKICMAMDALGKRDEAVSAIRAAVESEPESTSAWDLFVRICDKRKDSKVLTIALEEAISRLESRPNAVPRETAYLHVILAESLRDEPGSEARRERAANRAIEIDPGSLNAWALYASLTQDASERKSKLESALSSAQTTLAKAEQQLPTPLIVLLSVWKASSPATFREATSSLLNAFLNDSERGDTARLISNYSWIVEEMARALSQNGRVDTETGIAWYNLGRINKSLELWQAAEDAFSMALERLPENSKVEVIADKAECLANLGSLEDAIALINLASKSAPGDPNVIWTKARVLAKASRFAEARMQYRLLLLNNPSISVEVRNRIQSEMSALGSAP